MQKFLNMLEAKAPIVLRLGISGVILWFSFQQFMNAQQWTAYVPDSVVSLLHVSAVTLVFFNAVFEGVFGLMLAFGVYPRLSALLLALHLADITWVVGYGEIGVRDFGLTITTFVVFMNGADALCYHARQIVAPQPKVAAVPAESVRVPVRRLIQ